MHDDHTLVRGAKIECTESCPEVGRSVCTKVPRLEQVKDLADAMMMMIAVRAVG